MFPKPIEKSHRAWQIGYQALLPIAMLLWLAPLLAVALFSIRPDSDFSIGNYWGWPTSVEMIENYMMVFTSSMPRYIMNSFFITIPTVIGAVALSCMEFLFHHHPNGDWSGRAQLYDRLCTGRLQIPRQFADLLHVHCRQFRALSNPHGARARPDP